LMMMMMMVMMMIVIRRRRIMMMVMMILISKMMMIMMKHISILTTSPAPQHPLYSIAHLKSMKLLHWAASYPTPSTIVMDVMMIVVLMIG
jgi:hypothetical protein